jgi:integrase/recombinase XerC
MAISATTGTAASNGGSVMSLALSSVTTTTGQPSEVVGINISDFKDKDVLLVRGKGKKERLVIFGEYAQRALARWLPAREKLLRKWKVETEALLFSASNRRSLERLDVRSIGRIVKEVAKANDLPEYHPHLLRHACATHMHDRGAQLQIVARLLGHAQLGTAQIYTRVSTGRMLDVYRKAHPHARKIA